MYACCSQPKNERSRQSINHMHLKAILLCQRSIDHSKQCADENKSDRETGEQNANERWLAVGYETLRFCSVFDFILISFRLLFDLCFVYGLTSVSRFPRLVIRNIFNVLLKLCAQRIDLIFQTSSNDNLKFVFCCCLPSGFTRRFDDVIRVRSFQKK